MTVKYIIESCFSCKKDYKTHSKRKRLLCPKCVDKFVLYAFSKYGGVVKNNKVHCKCFKCGRDTTLSKRDFIAHKYCGACEKRVRRAYLEDMSDMTSGDTI